jgi:hypothetical protein
MQAIVKLCDKSKSINGKISTKSIFISHISCIDQDIHLKSISIGKSAWQFSVYVFGHIFTASSETFDPNNEELKSQHLKEIQQTLKDLLKIWNQIHNQQVSREFADCPN